MLEDKNGENDDSAVRIVKRRVARGAAVAARLAQEGVLEHDKRIRNQFRRCLEPAFAATDHVIIGSVSGAVTHHTKSWLYDMLSDFLDEHSEPESIGAAVILGTMLPDSHERTAEVKARILEASEAFRSVVFALVGTLSRIESRESALEFPDWFLEVVLQSLLKPEWTKFPDDGLQAAFYVLRTSGKRLKRVALACGLPGRIAGLCPHLFSSLDSSEEPLRAQASVQKGKLDFTYFVRPVGLNFKRWGPRVWREFEETSGIVLLISKIFVLARSPSRENFHALLAEAGNELRALYSLPSQIQSFLPVDRWDISHWRLETWCRMTSEEIAKGISREYFGCDYSVGVRTIETIEDWCELIDAYPHIALEMLGSRESTHFTEKELETIFERFVARAADEPGFIILEPGLLGKLLAGIQPRLEQLFRRLIVQAAAGPVRTKGIERVHPFPLNLPNEGCVLPHIVSALLSKVGSARWPYMLYPGHEPLKSHDISAIVKAYLAKPDGLLMLAEDDDVSRIVRVAALIMYLLHPQCDTTRVIDLHELLNSLQDEAARPWYLKGCATVFESAVAMGDDNAMRSLGAILHDLNGDFESRLETDPIWESWRQTSIAPVTNSHKPELWT